MNNDLEVPITFTRKQYLVDKVEINIYRWFKNAAFSTVTFKDKVFHFKPLGFDRYVTVFDRTSDFKKDRGHYHDENGKKDGGYQLCYSQSFNLITLLRAELEREYPAELLAAKGVKGDNFLPVKLRQHLLAEGISISSLRNRGIKLLIAEIEKTTKAIHEHMETKYGVWSWEGQDFKTSINYAEIIYDIVGPPGFELAQNKEVQEGFMSRVEEISPGVYVDKEGRTTLPNISPDQITSVDPITSERRRFRLKVRFHDGSIGLLYQKQDDESGSINRFERKIWKKNLKRRRLGNSFKSSKKLRSILDTLATGTYHSLRAAIPEHRIVKTAEMMDYVKGLCKKHYKHNWETAFQSLTTGALCICTGRTQETFQPELVRVTTALANQHKKFLKAKVDCLRGGFYVIDWDWVERKFKPPGQAQRNTFKTEDATLTY